MQRWVNVVTVVEGHTSKFIKRSNEHFYYNGSYDDIDYKTLIIHL